MAPLPGWPVSPWWQVNHTGSFTSWKEQHSAISGAGNYSVYNPFFKLNYLLLLLFVCMSRGVYMPLCVCGSWRTTFRTWLSPSPCIPWIRLRLAGLYNKGFYPLSHPINPTMRGFIEYLVCCVLYTLYTNSTALLLNKELISQPKKCSSVVMPTELH